MTRSVSGKAAGRRLVVVAAHLAVWCCSYVGAFLLRFDGTIPADQRPNFYYGLTVVLGFRVAIFWWSGLFHGLLRYAGIPEVWAIVRATTISTILFVGSGVIVRPILEPRSVYLADWFLAMLGAAGMRLAVRVVRERGNHRTTDGKRVLLLGAGDAGETFLRELERAHRPGITVVGILDDDPAKHGSVVRGIRLYGAINEVTLRRATEDLDAQAAILAIPTAAGPRVREIFSMCRNLKIEVKTLPSLQQIVNGDVKVSMLRDVAIEDLLRREPIRLDEASLEGLLKGKRLLVTGGAGSIGSELARQAARYELAGLGLLDHNENGLFFLERELRAAFPALDLTPIIADVKDVTRMREVMRSFRPEVVLHAAAHKHVPMMEANPGEAIKNNVFGTCIVADVANAYGVEAFVLISTDKAVNPTSVMGASKRIAEMYLQTISQRARTKFVAVRFGNVLGSAGSVVQIFRDQIAKGGPVSVTHPDMTRYFMTIPEATQLVLQAAALAKGGEIFLLDMGEPVKIVDLARDMIRMSGFEPDVDVQVVFTGQRPGEKLFEELFHSSEGYSRTIHPKIFVGKIASVDGAAMEHAMRSLAHAASGSAPVEVRAAISQIVPEARLEGVRESADDSGDVVERLRAIDTLRLSVTSSGG